MVRKTSISKRDTLPRTVTVHEDIKTLKEDEMKVISDFLRVQIGSIFDWVFEASGQRKKTHELATYHGFIFLTCANSSYEGD